MNTTQNTRQLPMVQIAGEKAFDVSTIEWKEELPSPKWYTWRGILYWLFRQPQKNWKITFKQPESVFAKKIKPIYITEENKQWLDKQIDTHNTIVALTKYRENQQKIYSGGIQ